MKLWELIFLYIEHNRLSKEQNRVQNFHCLTIFHYCGFACKIRIVQHAGTFKMVHNMEISTYLHIYFFAAHIFINQLLINHHYR